MPSGDHEPSTVLLKLNLVKSPETLCDLSARLDTQESVLRRREMEVRFLGVSEEGVWPPDLAQHLIAYAQFIFFLAEAQTRVAPVLSEVHVQCEVLWVIKMHAG